MKSLIIPCINFVDVTVFNCAQTILKLFEYLHENTTSEPTVRLNVLIFHTAYDIPAYGLPLLQRVWYFDLLGT